MTLTPDEVRAKEFKVALRGYDVDEVDAFLDAVEAELRRLASAPPPVAVTPAGAGEQVPAAERAVRTLVLAEHAAEQLLGEARGDAERLRADARGEVERLRLGASDEVERLRADAQERAVATVAQARVAAEEALATARAEADDIVRRAHVAALSVERELADQARHDVAALQDERSRLEVAVADLTATERACRDRLAGLVGEHADVLQRLREAVAGGSGEVPVVRAA